MSSAESERTEQSFFRGKRHWSKIKDQVLGTYMPPYLAKVAKLGKQIVLVDGFAGPGKFEDGGSGSPHIICQAAEKQVPNKYIAIFVNRDSEHHGQLSRDMKTLIDRKSVVTILGRAADLLDKLNEILKEQTLFIYLDPFGLRGCEFSNLVPFLNRIKRHSTEIVINLSVPTIHRLASRRATTSGKLVSPKVHGFHDLLSRVLGGDYWKDIMWSAVGTPDERAEKVMILYRDALRKNGAIFTGSCPVREKEGTRLKYFITFCSGHPDALILMNDAMCNAYHQRTYEAVTKGTLFEGADWKTERDREDIYSFLCDAVVRNPGGSREAIWKYIVQSRFMVWHGTEYRNAVAELCKKGRLRFKDTRGTGRLNDDSLLFPRS